ncbi:MAG: endonuclease NucS domain-containing protein [Phycisphaerae bacterium]
MPRSYYRVMLGKGSSYAEEAIRDGFLGADFGISMDLSSQLSNDWRDFNRSVIPAYQRLFPTKSRIAAGLAMGSLWTTCKGIRDADVVLSPYGSDGYRAGQIRGGYRYVPSGPLPHRRAVEWSPIRIEKSGMSPELLASCHSQQTVVGINKHAAEIERILGETPLTNFSERDESIEDPSEFALERHLEDFLVAKWSNTELAKEFDIYSENGEPLGVQYPSDTGPMDILAVSHDRKKLLVVELKRGKASDAVVGQILRYMGYVKDQIAEEGQSVHGAIIAHEPDKRIRRALAIVPNICFYRYRITFQLLADQP